MSAEAVQEGQRLSLAARLALNADGILEQIARDYGVSTLEVVRNLQQGTAPSSTASCSPT
ncbi:MAG: hypothetical protein ACXWJV_03875 [Hyphomicrobium sp.]